MKAIIRKIKSILRRADFPIQKSKPLTARRIKIKIFDGLEAGKVPKQGEVR